MLIDYDCSESSNRYWLDFCDWHNLLVKLKAVSEMDCKRQKNYEASNPHDESFFDLDIDAIFDYFENFESLNESDITDASSRSSSTEFEVTDSESLVNSNTDSSQKSTHSKNHPEKGQPQESLKIIDLKQLEQRPDESRVDYLTRFPLLYQGCVNAGDFDAFNYLLEECCIPDMVMKMTPSLPPVTGRQYLAQMYSSVLESIPDYVYTCETPKLDHRIISCATYTKGTYISDDRNDFLWNFIAYGKDKDTKFKKTKQLFLKLSSEHQPIKFTLVGPLYFILNEKRTHIEKFIYICEHLEVDQRPLRLV